MSSGKQPLKVHDIDDAEAFVHSMIKQALPTAILTPEAREELQQTGLRLLWEMALRDKSQSGTGEHDAGSKFSGFASRFLPGKIRDAWHKQEGHTLRQGEDGKREWVIHDKPISLEGVMEATDESDTVVQLRAPEHRAEPEQEKEALAESLGAALDDHWAITRQTTIAVGLLLEEGLSHPQCAAQLGITEREVGAAQARIISIAPTLSGAQVA